MTLINFIFGMVFLLMVGGANVLIKNLGAETVPAALQPLALRWTQAGHSPRWIRRVMWLLFIVLALVFAAVLVFGIYKAVIQLGMKWNS